MCKIETEIKNLYNKDANCAYDSLKKLLRSSESSNETYSYMEEFIQMMKADNSYIRTRGILLCSANAKWDHENNLNQHIMEYVAHFEDVSPITARQCIQQAHHIAHYKPELCTILLNALQTANITYADSMQPLIYKDRKKAIRQVTLWMQEHKSV